ncbi:HNH/ENDO VII family nuclease [Enterococcus gilvus]|uniref:HNH/ENDO VII family nuclease n=1 Tax=Enterococcus gilvus TaxID=160453 RepID=UPI0036F3183F
MVISVAKNSKTRHINPNIVPSGIDRKSFSNWRSDYWKNRAKDFKYRGLLNERNNL